MTRHINRRNLQGKEGKERKKDRQRERKKDRKKEIKKERKKERKSIKTSEKLVIKYMYITLNTTFTSTSYLLTNKCCTWLRMTRHINRRNLQEKGLATERNKDRQRERKKERKKERILTKVSDRDSN